MSEPSGPDSGKPRRKGVPKLKVVNGDAGHASWEDLLQCNERGSRKGNEFNAAIALEHAPEFAGAIAYDLRENGIVVTRECPLGPPGRWTDVNTGAFVLWLQRRFIPVHPAHVETAVAVIAHRNRVDPLKDWLLSLPEKWDGRERLGHWLSIYCGAEETEANSLISSKFLIGAVARVLAMPARMDHMLVLEGLQGLGKSTLVKILGGDYASENISDFHGRDAMQIACSRWFIEIGELAAIRKSKLEEIKSFITRTEDAIVPKWGRHPVFLPRWSVLIGNVNPDGSSYLHDTTGNRRFWPVKIGKIDLDGLRRDRDQLFAEATYCFNRGDPWWVENDEQREILHIIQEDRVEDDSWTEIISAWMERRSYQTDVLTQEIARDALLLSAKDITRSVQTRIGICMKTLGFSRVRVRVSADKLQWVYRR